jgi:glycosyltransferase involved in cell wall biosynthesis
MKDKSKPIRVLHIVGGVMDVGGIEMFLMNYYRHIDRNVIQFDFCIVEEGEGHFDEEIHSLGGVIYNLPSKKRHPINHLKILLKVLKQYRNCPVHMHLDGMNGLYGLIALLNKNKIRISHSHNTNHLTNNITKRMIHDLLRYLNRFVNIHYTACGKDASLWLHGTPLTKTGLIIRNAVDTKKFSYNQSIREHYRRDYNINDEFIIGNIGRFHEQKNHIFMIEIAKELKINSFAFKLFLIGGGELLSKIVSLIAAENLMNNVLIINKTDVPHHYLNMMDLFILPSLYEGLPVSLIEAQTNGLNCIISDTISDEAIFSDAVVKIGIKNPKLWANKILSYSTKRLHPLVNPYSIKSNVEVMTKFYNGIINL